MFFQNKTIFTKHASFVYGFPLLYDVHSDKNDNIDIFIDVVSWLYNKNGNACANITYLKFKNYVIIEIKYKMLCLKCSQAKRGVTS